MPCARQARARCWLPTTATSSRRCARRSRDVATLGDDVPVDDIELAIVLGGDGTILRAAELVREGTAPVLGINMGHVGFLAEIERDDMDDAVRRVIARDYGVEERIALQVRVKDAADAVDLRDVGAERGDRREGQSRAHARGRHRDRRPTAVDLRLRRRRRLDPDRFDGLQLLRRRPGDLADRPGDRRRAAVGARAVREAARRRARARGRDRGARAHQRRRHPVVRRPALARSAARARASWCGAPSVRCGWRACIPRPFTDRLVRKFRLPVDGLARAAAIRGR